MKIRLADIFIVCILIVNFAAMLEVRTAAQTLTVVHAFAYDYNGGLPGSYFTNADGATPFARLLLYSNVLYGTTENGTSNGYGSVFAVNTDGSGFRSLYDFTGGTNGSEPVAGLILSGDTLYGTASESYPLCGVVFAIKTDGSDYTNIYNFSGADGKSPFSNLTLSADTLYGTTVSGGGDDYGTVFAVNTDGTGFTNVLSFEDAYDFPYGGVILSTNILYGTTSEGGSGSGTVFAVGTDGTGFTNLHVFNASDGNMPESDLALSAGRLYGTTYVGGSAANGTIFAINTDGTGFTNLHMFTPTTGSGPYTNFDDANPNGVTLAGNTLYGTTFQGGNNGRGTVFALNVDGTGFTTLHSFTAPTPYTYYGTNGEGYSPQSGLILEFIS